MTSEYILTSHYIGDIALITQLTLFHYNKIFDEIIIGYNNLFQKEGDDHNILILFISQPSNDIIQCKSFEVRNIDNLCRFTRVYSIISMVFIRSFLEPKYIVHY